MKTTFKILAAAVSMGVALTAGAGAQTQPAGSISELLNRVRSDAREASQETRLVCVSSRTARTSSKPC